MKYIDLPLPELYDLVADPEEAHNLAGSRARTGERMRAHRAQLGAADRGLGPEAETAEVRERLKSLGYAVAGAPAKGRRYTEDDDPKRLISLGAALDELIRLYRAGELPRARVLGEDIVRRRPMPVAFLHLAFVERESGALPPPVDPAANAFALTPQTP